MVKNENLGKSFSGSQNGTMRGLQIRTGSKDCKSGKRDYK